MRRIATILAALTGALAFAGLAPGGAQATANPFAGANLWVDPDSNARRQANEWREHRPADAEAMMEIARRSQADWFGEWSNPIRRSIDAQVTRITRAGALPVLVAYNIPKRDCFGYSGGGARSVAAYRKWVRRLARGIGKRRAAVILEPDALAGIDCLRRRDRRTRLRLLRFAVRILAARTRAGTYIDAGHSGWQPAAVIRRRLQRAGVRRARGFALNVSNFRFTGTEAAYGREVGRGLGRRHFVVDVSRNGAGPAPGDEWCNPPGRALGGPPATQPGRRLVDALLWIKRPGESDGACNGGPRAGAWWPEYALGLARRSILLDPFPR